jgi:hypothetical protein
VDACIIPWVTLNWDRPVVVYSNNVWTILVSNPYEGMLIVYEGYPEKRMSSHYRWIIWDDPCSVCDKDIVFTRLSRFTQKISIVTS